MGGNPEVLINPVQPPSLQPFGHGELLQLTIALLGPVAGDPKRSPKVAKVCFFKEAEPKMGYFRSEATCLKSTVSEKLFPLKTRGQP